MDMNMNILEYVPCYSNFSYYHYVYHSINQSEVNIDLFSTTFIIVTIGSCGAV
jgi:hypothetical protein